VPFGLTQVYRDTLLVLFAFLLFSLIARPGRQQLHCINRTITRSRSNDRPEGAGAALLSERAEGRFKEGGYHYPISLGTRKASR
jgi:hypothetical protein